MLSITVAATEHTINGNAIISGMGDQQTPKVDVLIIGGGVAGLAAAGVLGRAGRSCAIVEARDRFGGRILTRRVSRFPMPIELGAEFLHGTPRELWRLVEDAGLAAYEAGGDEWWSDDSTLKPSGGLWSAADRLFERMAAYDGADQTVAAWLAQFRDNPELHAAADLVAGYVEGFDAAETERASLAGVGREQRAEAVTEGDRSFRLPAGFDRLVRRLMQRLRGMPAALHRGTEVQRLQWEPGAVEARARAVHTSEQRTFNARAAIVTLPLGVLQAPPDTPGHVRFEPALPTKHAALAGLAMGQVVKVVLRFSERFWEHERLPLQSDDMTPARLSFVLSRDRSMPTWWTHYPVLVPQITGWAGGPAALRLVGLPEQAILEQALSALARILGVARGRVDELLVGWHWHNWHTDPYARGAYSYVLAGGLAAQQALAEPVAGTLFWAGEATDTSGQIGTVQGALVSGERAAREALATLGNGA